MCFVSSDGIPELILEGAASRSCRLVEDFKYNGGLHLASDLANPTLQQPYVSEVHVAHYQTLLTNPYGMNAAAMVKLCQQELMYSRQHAIVKVSSGHHVKELNCK